MTVSSDLEITSSISDIRNLYDTLGTSSRLARDECGDWNIYGTRGKLYTDEKFGYLYLYIDQSWGRAKRTLSFMEVHQDGDAEGILRLDRLPTEQEARLIRKWAGLGTKRKLTPERRAKLVEAGRNFRFSHGAEHRKSCSDIDSNRLQA
jgi:hypothetical protein